MGAVNWLGGATSPYLLQHKDNPVDWWEWSDEAFAEARRRDVPVLLSVGYAACHWCHVMAHESFEDDAVAAEHERARVRVSIKVDREERPDVDAVYMDATTALTGHGGWPMTCLLTHDGAPFYAGTYFEPRTQFPAAARVPCNRGVDDERRPRWSPPAARIVEAAGPRSARGRRSGRRRDCGEATSTPRPTTLVGQFDRVAGGVRRRAEVPAVDGARVPAAPPRAHG